MTSPSLQKSIHARLTLLLQAILLVGVLLSLWNGRWLTAATTASIILITLLPILLEKRFQVFIPPEFEFLAILFVFASLFLGEVLDYYQRLWWWDMMLHTVSGLLLGITGFLLVYVMNESDLFGLDMSPGFVVLFAFMFAVGMGAIWEIFEFAMDQLFGTDMQKEMLGDPSGLTDTMWDLIADTTGAAVISVLGLSYLRSAGKDSFLERWIASFILANPGMFGKGR
ncbi:MAG: hypothetical protein HKN17_10735 [Rhodothermales bacterium]|nr:hypothetical protein [Rhodothermales bacterium]